MKQLNGDPVHVGISEQKVQIKVTDYGSVGTSSNPNLVL